MTRADNTVWERFGRHPDADYSGNRELNPGSDFSLAEFALSECSCSIFVTYAQSFYKMWYDVIVEQEAGQLLIAVVLFLFTVGCSCYFWCNV